jgi:hypothetical protein
MSKLNTPLLYGFQLRLLMPTNWRRLDPSVFELIPSPYVQYSYAYGLDQLLMLVLRASKYFTSDRFILVLFYNHTSRVIKVLNARLMYISYHYIIIGMIAVVELLLYK